MFNRLGIIALPRTGSSALYNYICALFPNYRKAFEPMNPKVNAGTPPITELITRDNIIIKHLIPQELNIHKTQVDTEYRVGKPNVSKRMAETFDKIILLTRKNKVKLLESLYYATINNIWFAKYDATNIRDGIEKFDLYKAIVESDKYISLLSIEYNLPIFYYEDLFSNKIEFENALEQLNLPFDEKLYDRYIDKKHKYRQDGN